MTTNNVVDFKNVKSVIITENRWDIKIVIIDSDGKTHGYLASADSFYTDNDGIWFGTEEESQKLLDAE